MNMDAIYDIDELWTLEMDSEHLSIRLSDMHDPHPECWSPLETGRKANVVRHDALLSGQPIKTEHSYSLCSDGDSLPDSPGSMHHHSPTHHQQQQPLSQSLTQQHHLLNQQQHHVLNQQAHQLNNHLNNHLQQQQQQLLLQQNHHQTQPNLHHQQQQQQHQQQQHIISHHSHNSHIQRHDDIGDGVDDDYDVDDIFPRKATVGALTQKPATVASYHVSTANGNKRQRSASPATQSAVSPSAIHLPTSNVRAGRNAIAVRQQQHQQQQNQLQQLKQKQRQQRQTYATTRDTNDININISDVLDAAMLHVKHEPMSPSDTGSCASPSPSSNNDLELDGQDGGAIAMMLGEHRTAMSDDDDDDDEHEMDDDEDDDDEEEDVHAEDEDVNVDTSGYTALQQQKLMHHQQQQQRKQHQQQQQQRRIGAIGKLNIKMEPQQLASTPMTSQSAFGLPPTPSSSSSSDDFESSSSNSPLQQHTAGGMLLLSPSGRRTSQAHSNRSSPSSSPSVGRGGGGGGGGGANSSSSSTSSVSSGVGYVGTSSRQPIHTPLISSQPKGSTGSLLLTEEEKRTLQAEGYPIPTRLPLTKAEEKSLKKIRRKIKNKISAQESRRKKKEYMDQLERKVEILEAERNGHQANSQTYQRRVTQLEDQNAAFRKRIEALEAKLSMVN